MLTIQQSQSAAAATRYFDQSLSADDYYLSESVDASWSGELCQSLGLQPGSLVEREHFVSLLNGQHPTKGSRLTQTRRTDRRPCLDITVSAPKSVSLAAIIDPKVEAAFLEAADEFLRRDVEPLIHRRERKGKYKNTRQQKHVGKGIFARFLHRTARPTESGPPDVHLHAHCLAFNSVEDGGRWYAAEMERVVSSRAALQARFEARLASRLAQLGYHPERVAYRHGGKLKHGWELRGIDRAMIEKHSKRAEEIESAAKEAGLSGAVEKRGLAQKTRKRKSAKPRSIETLKREWLDRMTPEERKALHSLRDRKAIDAKAPQPAISESICYAVDHCFERKSTAELNELVGEALRHGVVHHPEEVEAAIKRGDSGVLRRGQTVNGTERVLTTTPEILAIEKETVALAKASRGTRRPLNENHSIRRDFLNEQQRSAVQTILTDRNGITIVAGGAGTGKTSMLIEAKEGVEVTGKKVFAVAPSTGAVAVLQEKGFESSQTAAHLIHNQKLQAELRGQTLFVDEAGLLDMRSCRDLVRITNQQDCRLVLIGDSRQHGSVGRGEGYRLLQHEAGLKVARLAKVQRQKGDYRAAIENIAKGNEKFDASERSGVEVGFEMLVKQEKVIPVGREELQDRLTERYFEEIRKGNSAIIVAPTHAEGAKLSAAIRERLMEEGELAKQEHDVDQLVSLNLTEAEKRDQRNYDDKSLVVQFTQNVPGIRRGSRFQVVQSKSGPRLQAEGTGASIELPIKHADRFEVYRTQSLDLAVGDRIRMTHSGKDQNGRRIINGRTDHVSKIHDGGQLEMRSGLLLSAKHGHLAYAYTSTSYRAQGADADVAITSLSSQSLPAVNSRALYVAASRGKRDLAVYCDDVGAVRRAIVRSGEEQTATELMRTSRPVNQVSRKRDRTIQRQRRQAFANRVRHWWNSQRGVQAARTAQPRQSVIARPNQTLFLRRRSR